MTKKLNEDSLSSELSGSAFFSQPAPKSPAPAAAKPKVIKPAPAKVSLPSLAAKVEPQTSTIPTATDTQAYARTSGRTPGRTPFRSSGRRIITRYAFEFFQDQLETLKRLSLDQQYQGEKGSMSQMVREALDAYISRLLNQEDGDGDARTAVRSDGGNDL